ncbi:MAG: M24 family metallopeptidase [Desulfomonilaceae bacterium]
MSSTVPIALIRDKLKKLKLDAALFNTSEITRSTNVTYLSGFTGSDAAVLITREQLRLFTDGRYKIQSKLECSNYQVHVTRDKIASIAKVIDRLGIGRLGIEGNRISFDFISALKRAAKKVEVVSFNARDLTALRIIKNQSELENIRTAAHIASSACKDLLASGIMGKSELEVAGRMELLFKQGGASAESFETIVASGVRSSLPHGRPTDKLIQLGDLVIIDFGCIVTSYCSDETVTCIVGNANSEKKKIHAVVQHAHDKAIESLKVGIKASEVDRVAREIISKAGYGKFFLHSLGHGVGLDVHEPPYLSPRSNSILDSGMVFTIEPGVYIEGFGGVRLESLVYLSSVGVEILSESPKSLISVE